MWFWVKDEWAKSFLDNPNFINKLLKNYNCTGWTDKLCHYILHLLLVLILTICLKLTLWKSAIASIGSGILYEYIADCLIFKHGASKFDLFFNTAGMITAVLVLKLGGIQ